MVNKTNLGKVVGDSAFEEWFKKNPGKTWEDFMIAIKGPGILEFRYRETTETGGMIYDVILEGGIIGGTIEIPPGPAGADFITLEFIRFDDNGNTVVRSKNSKGGYGEEILINRGPRGYTGGTGEGELPPGDYLYGEIREFSGETPPSGWMYTNGGTIEKRRYPHMSFLPGVTQPVEPYFKIDGGTKLTSKGNIENQETWEFTLENEIGKIYQEFTKGPNVANGVSFDSFLKNTGKGTGSYYYGMTNKYYYISLPEKLALSFVSMNRTNASGNSTTTNNITNKNVDVYFDIEYMDENGDWIKGVELHNKTDFVPLTESSESASAMIKSSFKSNKFRIIINNKSLYNYNSLGTNIYYIGEVVFGFDKGGTQYNDYIQLPNERDNQGRYKIVYVGQPLEITEPTVFSYNIDNIHNGEMPLFLAIENKIPTFSNGITMSEPNILKLGYTNKYNRNSDSWELIKTHENKEGYYYDNLGELKYIPKPFNWVRWDFINNNWIEDTLLKEKAKKKLLDKYIELEMKKDKMLDLKLNTASIVEEIEKTKKDLEEFNG